MTFAAMYTVFFKHIHIQVYRTQDKLIAKNSVNDFIFKIISFQIFSSYSRNCILFLYVFFYFMLLVTFVFYISQLKIESYHRDLLGSRAESFFASICVKYSMEVEGGFPVPIRRIFFDANFSNNRALAFFDAYNLI